MMHNNYTNWVRYYSTIKNGHLFPDYESKQTADLYKNKVLSFCQKYKEPTILELGCGIARFSFIIAKEHKSYIVGIDLLRSILQEAKELFKRRQLNADFIVADVRLLPLKDETFDFIHSQGLYEHFKGSDRQRVFSESTRVLKYGGTLFLTVPNKLNLMWSFSLLKGKLFKRFPFPDEQPFTIKEITRRILETGCLLIEIGGINKQTFIILWIIGHLSKIIPLNKLFNLTYFANRISDTSMKYGNGFSWLVFARCLYIFARKCL